MSDNERNWTVLIIGGPSGTGKSTLAYEISKHYGVNVLELDDISEAFFAMTTQEMFPEMFEGKKENWMDLGIEGNKNWLINVSKAFAPALKAIAERHVDDNVPIIIEGDFIHPEVTLLERVIEK
ncbi:MAG: hypothetical protein FWE27_01645 [Defluviitaleaceae bacterium]|nr:hypothetical protein [Defluviitaleaceae bacterium]